jgi:hypothetical protein
MKHGGDELRRVFHRTSKLARRSKRWWPIYLLASIVAVLAGVLAPRIVKPMYSSAAVLVYRELIPSSTLLGDDAPMETPRQRGARLKEMLLARSNIEEVIDELGLYPEIVASLGKNEAVNEFLEDVDCKVGEDTFAIRFDYPEPETAQATTARLARLLMEQSAHYRHEQAQSTTSFLVTQRDRTKKELAEKEQALARFLAAHPEFAEDMMASGGVSQAGASIRAQERKAAAPNPTVDALARQRSRLHTRMDSIDKPSAAPTAEDKASLDPEIAGALDQARADFERARQELSTARAHYTDKHPDVQHAEGSMARAKAALEIAQRAASEATPPARATAPPAIESDRAELRQQLSRVDQTLAAARRAAGAQPGDDEVGGSNWIVELETEWASLNREVYDVRERYQQIERRHFQASILDHVEAAGGAAQMTVVDAAYLPQRPSRRGRIRVGASAALGVLLLFGAFIALLAYTDDRFYDLDDVHELPLEGISHAVPTNTTRKRHG